MLASASVYGHLKSAGQYGLKAGEIVFDWAAIQKRKERVVKKATAGVGMLLKKLEELGIADNTIVLYSTDNGFELMMWPDGGYAPFRGGPLNYARTRGVENVASTLRRLATRFGDRFAPDAGWDNFR